MTDDTTFLALATLVATSVTALATQFIALRKQETSARMLLEQTKADVTLLAEQTKASANILADKTEASANMLAHKTDDNGKQIADELKRGSAITAQIAANSTELKDLVKENTSVTLDGAKAAKDAYQEANQVNIWRTEVNSEIKKLAESVQVIAAGIKQVNDKDHAAKP